jgi:hypothetical protein
MLRRRVWEILGNPRRLRWGATALIAGVLLAGVSGCTRSFFRKAADNEVDGILAEKDTCPIWKIEQYHVYPDPRSRWADPSNPDRPPQPPDDVATYLHSPHPQAPGKSGVAYFQGTGWLDMLKLWDEANRRERKEAEEREEQEERAADQDEGETALPGWLNLPLARYFPGSVFLGPEPAVWLGATGVHGTEEPADDIVLVGGPAGYGAGPTVVTESNRHPVATYFDEPLNAKQHGFLLKLDQSVELGVINSPLYQNFREQLYEEALPVTSQRFNFAYQLAASEDFIRSWAGPNGFSRGAAATSSTTANLGTGSGTSTPSTSQLSQSPGISSNATSPTSSSTTGPSAAATAGGVNNTVASSTTSTPGFGPGVNNWTGISTFSFSKLFVTGALLTFDFVNTNVWNFVAPKGFTSTSTVDLTFTQPFLQGGGKAVTLEPLTQAERNLFYGIRAYARFREQFYADVALGTTPPTDLAAAIQASGTNPISVLAALNVASTDVSGGFISFLSTLYRECDMAADKKLVLDLERALRIYEGYQEGGQFSPLQVDQVRSTLLTAQNTVLTDQQFVTNAVDQFKLILGMPANTPLILDDTPCRGITRQLDRYYAVILDSDAAYKKVEAQEELPPEKLRSFLEQLYRHDRLVQGTEARKKIPAIWNTWVKMTDAAIKERLSKLRDERRRLFDLKTDLALRGEAMPEKDAQRLVDSEIEADMGALEQEMRKYEARKWLKEAKPELRTVERIKQFRMVAYQAEVALVWARNERFEAVFKLWPELPKAPLPCRPDVDLSTAEVQMAQQLAVQHSLSSRWDLMNARAQLVDAWRQVRVTANALMAVFTVQGNLASSTAPSLTHPFAFKTPASAASLSINTQLPLNRLVQRNAYRTALINLQQARRNLTTFEDNIAVQVRFDVRQLQLFANNYRIQKRVLQSLYSQVESALEVITAPADPAALQATGTTGQANAAALTTQYLTALSSLNGSQTRMYDIWLSYLATRIQLYLDLESLRMDNRGVWIEPGTLQLDEKTLGEPGRLPAPVREAPAPTEELPPPKPAGM